MNEMITIPRAEYDRLREAAEDLADIQAYDRAMAAGEESFPSEVVDRIVDGESPLRVFRELRGLSQTALSAASGVNRVQIADIESGRRSASVETFRKLAQALNLTIDDLV
ncbi:helix-turn-helix transcriptional regulator [Devosia submarina]|uniref:helix-turn-helix transcriptional regulator n=1 Tax=Devosia submarina TaxID=1173082 RepID=UPI000D3D5F53|nr:helix-turn-helix transcriptional regulator [Devosia submarina]